MDDEGLPAELGGALDAFAQYLSAERAVSPHTLRGYLGDVRSLLSHAASEGAVRLQDLELGTLRRWLGAQSQEGAARSTLARRSAAVRVFTAWAMAEERITTDPALRLKAPKREQSLPGVLQAGQLTRLLATLDDAAADLPADPDGPLVIPAFDAHAADSRSVATTSRSMSARRSARTPVRRSRSPKSWPSSAPRPSRAPSSERITELMASVSTRWMTGWAEFSSVSTSVAGAVRARGISAPGRRAGPTPGSARSTYFLPSSVRSRIEARVALESSMAWSTDIVTRIVPAGSRRSTPVTRPTSTPATRTGSPPPSPLAESNTAATS